MKLPGEKRRGREREKEERIAGKEKKNEITVHFFEEKEPLRYS